MIGVLVTSHGNYCEEIVESGKMIIGEHDNIRTVTLEESGIDAFANKLSETLDEMFNEFNSVLILCDLKGGTPCNESMKYILYSQKDAVIVPGVNLPMYLEVVSSTSFIKNLGELAEIAKNTGTNSIEIINI